MNLLAVARWFCLAVSCTTTIQGSLPSSVSAGVKYWSCDTPWHLLRGVTRYYYFTLLAHMTSQEEPIAQYRRDALSRLACTVSAPGSEPGYNALRIYFHICVDPSRTPAIIHFNIALRSHAGGAWCCTVSYLDWHRKLTNWRIYSAGL
jgi:hypothetical protein